MTPSSSDIALSAVILTGERNSKSRLQNALLQGTGIQNKVLLPVGGTPMLCAVFQTVSQSVYRPTMHVSTNDPDIGITLEAQQLLTQSPLKTLPADRTATGSLLSAIRQLHQSPYILFVSGDHPLLTPEMVDYFVAEALERDLALGVAAVNRSVVQRQYPQSRRTYMPLKNGAYSGGNMLLIKTADFHANPEILEMIDRNRKRPWKSIYKLGFWGILQVVFRQLDIHELMVRGSQIIGCKTGIVEMPFAECCMDVDKPSDKVMAELILARRQQAAAAQLSTSTEVQPVSVPLLGAFQEA